MQLHPLRAYLQGGRLEAFVRRRPVLLKGARMAWRLGRRLRYRLMAPSSYVLFPYFCIAFLAGLASVRPRLSGTSIKRRPPEIAMLAISEVFRDPRIEREARALASAGFAVKIIYPDYFSVAHNITSIDWGPGITFVPIRQAAMNYVGSFPYLFGTELFRWAIKQSPFAFHAHDLDTALIALAAAGWRRCHCVCDFHEWYSENVTWSARKKAYIPHPPLKRAVYRAAERLALRRASAVVTVCESIASELGRTVDPPRQIEVVRNIPSLAEPREVQSHGSLQQTAGGRGRFVLLYQGGVGPSRLLEPVIEAMAFAPAVHLVIRGPGMEYYGQGYLALARERNLLDRVTCLPPVPSHEVVAAARTADAGLWTLPNLCKNFSFALPNKVFEYMAAGLPLLVADYPEVRKLVERYQVGLLFDPYSPQSIAAAVNQLVDNPELQHALRENAAAAMKDLRADAEWLKLVSLYRMLPVAGVQSVAA